jgi:hypothetical protein
MNTQPRDLTVLLDAIRAKVKAEMPDAKIDLLVFIHNDLQPGVIGNWVRGRIILGGNTFGFGAMALTDNIPDVVNKGMAALREKKLGKVGA